MRSLSSRSSRTRPAIGFGAVRRRSEHKVQAIDSVDFREAQHKHWDSAAVGWKECSELNDRADAHISERLASLLTCSRKARSWTSPPAMAGRRSPPRVRLAQRAALWPRTSPPRCSRSGVNARRRPARATSSSCRRTPPASIFRSRASTPPSRAGGSSSSSLTRRLPRGASEGSSSRGARMAISSWGEPDQVPFLCVPMRTTMERLDVPRASAGAPRSLSRPTPAAVGGVLEGGGFDRRRGAKRGHLRVRLPGALHGLHQSDLRPDPGDDRAARWRSPGRGLGRDHPGRSDCGGGSKPLSFSNVVLLASATAQRAPRTIREVDDEPVGKRRLRSAPGTPNSRPTRDRLVAIALATVGFDILCAVLALRVEHHQTGRRSVQRDRAERRQR